MKQFVLASILVCFSCGPLQAMLGEEDEMELLELSEPREKEQKGESDADYYGSQGCWKIITSWCCYSD